MKIPAARLDGIYAPVKQKKPMGSRAKLHLNKLAGNMLALLNPRNSTGRAVAVKMNVSNQLRKVGNHLT